MHQIYEPDEQTVYGEEGHAWGDVTGKESECKMKWEREGGRENKERGGPDRRGEGLGEERQDEVGRRQARKRKFVGSILGPVAPGWGRAVYTVIYYSYFFFSCSLCHRPRCTTGDGAATRRLWTPACSSYHSEKKRSVVIIAKGKLKSGSLSLGIS